MYRCLLAVLLLLNLGACEKELGRRLLPSGDAPWIDATSPRLGTSGTEVTLRGSFGTVAGSVAVGGQPAEVSSWGESEVRIVVPENVSPGRVHIELVSSAGVLSNRMPFFQRGPAVWVPHFHSDPLVFGTAAWTGREIVLFLGAEPAALTQSGGAVLRYNPVSETWVMGSSVGAPAPREYARTFWTGDEYVVLGGNEPCGQSCIETVELRGGGAYDPRADEWRPLSAPGGP